MFDGLHTIGWGKTDVFDTFHEEEIADDKLGRAWSPRLIGSDGAKRQSFSLLLHLSRQ